MSETTKNGKNLILENTIVSYSPKDDTIHITSADPDLRGKPFHISLNQSSPTENALRELLIETGIIKEELIGTNLPETLTHPDSFNENPEIFELGVSRKGAISWNPANDSHLGIYGGTGSGKTVVANNILLQALSNQDVWDVYCVDPKKVEYSQIKNILPSPENYATEIEGLYHILNEVFEARSKSLAQGENPRKTILFIDELVSLIEKNPGETVEDSRTRENVLNLLNSLLRCGRSAGIYFVFTSQRPDPQELVRNNISSVVLMGKNSEITSKIALGSNVAVRTPKVRGRGWFKFGNTEPAQFQSYYYPLSEFKKL